MRFRTLVCAIGAALVTVGAAQAAPNFVISTVTVDGGNGNGFVDQVECNDLTVTLTNNGSLASNINATLSSPTPGVFITQNFSKYPDLAMGSSNTNNTTFRLSTSNAFGPGNKIDLALSIVTSQGTFVVSSIINPQSAATTRVDSSGSQAIPDKSTINSTLAVAGITGTITTVTVSFFVTHPRDNDLIFTLVGPDNTAVTLSNRHGGNGDNYGSNCSPDTQRCTLSDTATLTIAAGSPPFAGSFRPDQPLSVFKNKTGAGANGNWTLRVRDAKKKNLGTLHCWSLNIQWVPNAPDGGSCPGTPTADVSLTKKASAASVPNGQNVVYTFVARNNGPNYANAVTITDPLPGALTFVSATTTSGSFTQSSGLVTFNLGGLPNGAITTQTITATVGDNITFQNLAVIQANELDTNTSNNFGTATVTGLSTVDLAVSNSDSPDPAVSGSNLTYDFSVTNAGPDSATTVTVTDVLPAATSFVSANVTSGSCSFDGTKVTCLIPGLDPGDNESGAITLNPNLCGTLTNGISVSSAEIESSPSNNTSTATTTVNNPPPGVQINPPSDSFTTGTPVSYTVTYTGAQSISLIAGNVTLNKTGTANGIVGVSSPTSNTRTLTVSSLTGVGTIGISIASGTAQACGGANAVAAGPSLVFDVNVNTFTVIQDDVLTDSQNLGWSVFPQPGAGRLESNSYDGAETALLATVGSDPGSNWATFGWITNGQNGSQSLTYASVGTDRIVRAKFFMYATGQTGAASNQIPSLRMRVANRFAVTANLIVKTGSSFVGEALDADIAPVTTPASPSVYKVDLDPTDTPRLVSNAANEQFLRAFEIYDNAAAVNGSIGMTEAQIGTYPAVALQDSGTTVVPVASPTGLIKSYVAGPNGGDFGQAGSPNFSALTVKYNGLVVDGSGGQPSLTGNSLGIVMDTLTVESDRLGIAAWDMFGGTEEYPRTTATRQISARVESGKMYKVMFHATATVNSNRQPLLRFRAKSLAFDWTSTLEINGANATGIGSNSYRISSEISPGAGNALPPADRLPADNAGGWYKVIMASPMDTEIKTVQPALSAQDGPGVCSNAASNTVSRRDIQVGADMIDDFGGVGSIELGQMQIDRVAITKLDAVQ